MEPKFEQTNELSEIGKILESKDLSPEERYIEMSQLLKEASEIIENQKREGDGIIGETVAETFNKNKLNKSTVDRYFYILPKQKEGDLIAVSDLHGDLDALKKAAKFLENKNNHLISLGDNVVSSFSSKGNEDQIKTLEILLKLYIKFPDRVHLLRGNCEVDVLPAGGFGEDIYRKQGLKGFKNNIKRINNLFNKMPLGFITETGVAGVHGLLPRGIKKDGDLCYRNLKEINEFSDYQDESKFSGREINRILWGELDENSDSEFKKGEEGMVSGKEGALKTLEAIGGSVLIRGHQHSLARRKGGASSIDFDGRVGTFVSHEEEDDRRIAIIPLNGKVEKISEEMFLKI